MTITRKNQFEELIDALMIDEVAGIDQEIRNTLMGLDTDKKRMAILSILDKDRDMFMKIKGIVGDNSVTKAEHIKNVVAMLRDYVKVGEVEKKTLGEVMTPNFLVNDMLNTLPAEVWSNPSLKWLDPCSGVGVFACVIVERLMEGLKDAIPNDEERYKHIVENMLYVGELQPKNMFLFLCAFDPRDEYGMNVYTGSFLVEDFDNHSKNVWGIDKFDIIVQNPPYQTNKEGEKKTHPIWDKFVKKALKITVDGGYNVNVHPSGWRNVDGRFKDTQILMRSKQMLYLEIHNADDGVKTFGAATRYDFYCIENAAPCRQTKVVCEDGSIEIIDLSDMEFIPNGKFGEIKNLIAKKDEETVEILHSYSIYETRKEYMSKELTKEFKFPCIQNVNVKNEIGLLYYSNTKDKGHFGTSKVIFGRFGINAFIDEFGDYGLCQDCSGIVDIQHNLLKIKHAIKSKNFLIIMKMVDVSGIKDTPVNRKVLSTFRKDFWKEFLD